MLAIGINIFLPQILYPIWMFRRTTGVFRQTRNILIYAGVVNLVLSYILGKRMGLSGIILATSVSRLLTSFWFEPVILYKVIFPSYHVSGYFLTVIKSLFIAVLSIVCFDRLSFLLPSGIIGVLLAVILSFVLSMAWLLLFNFRDPSMKKVLNTVKGIIKRH